MIFGDKNVRIKASLQTKTLLNKNFANNSFRTSTRIKSNAFLKYKCLGLQKSIVSWWGKTKVL